MALFKRRLRKILELPKFFINLIFECVCLAVASLYTFFHRLDTRIRILSVFITVSLIVYIGVGEDYDSSDLYRNQVPSLEYFYSLNDTLFHTNSKHDRVTVTLAFVVCSTRLSEAVTMLKTAIFFSRNANVNLHLIAVADLKNEIPLAKQLKELSEAAMLLDIQVDYEIHRIWLPSMPSKKYWVEMFAPCSSQRLFFPLALPHIDHLMYTDTDVLFLSNITDLWNEFKNMKPLNLAAVAAEHELPGDGWYNRRSLIPYYGPRGLNTGVMLMNLTAMRYINFGDRIEAIFQHYGSTIKWADQDLLNILFHFDPDFLHELDCKFNYRFQHCKCDYPGTGDCGCKSAERNGISIFHGNRNKFHSFPFSKAPAFIKNIYDAFSRYDLRSDTPELLLKQMMKEYTDLARTQTDEPCTNISRALFTNFERFTVRGR